VKPLLLVLAALLLLPAMWVDAGKKHRIPDKRIVVEDHTSAAWDGIIAETVDDFNRVMPKKGPKLVYKRGEAIACASSITVCAGDIAPYWGLAIYNTDSIGDGAIQVTDDPAITPALREAVACHEFMHILTGIRDNYGANPQSCVWGWRDAPGPFDIEYLDDFYDNPKHKHHKKHGGRR
jgi:hypothetical protein